MQMPHLLSAFIARKIVGQFPCVPVFAPTAFTNYFREDLRLTMRFFRRRVLMPREKIAAVAALSQGAHSAKSQAVTHSAALRSIRWRPDFLAPEWRARRNP